MAQEPTEYSEAKNAGVPWKLTTSALGLAVFIGSGVVILMDRFEPWGLSLILSLILLAIFVLLALTPWLERRHYLFHPLYIVLVSFGIGYLARSFYIISGNYETMVGFELGGGSQYLWRALAVVSLGAVSLLVGYRLSLGKQMTHRLPMFSPQVNRRRLVFVIVLYFAIGLAFYVLYLKSLGGIAFSLDELTEKRRSSYQFLRFGSWLIYVAVFLGFIYYAKIRRRFIWWLVLAGALLIPLVSQARKEILLIMLVVLVIYHHLIRRISVLRSLLLVVLLAAVSMAMLSQRNQEGFTPERLIEGLEPNIVVEKTVGGRDFADITTVAHIVRYVDSDDALLKGESIVEFYARFIPRAIWEEKPINLGKEVAVLFYDEALGRPGGAGVPPSLIAELFWNFHVPGVILGMVVFGVFLRMSIEYVRRSPSNPWTVLLYGITLVYIFQQAGGQMASETFRYLVLLLPSLIAVLFVTWRSSATLKSAEKVGPAQIISSDQTALTQNGGATRA